MSVALSLVAALVATVSLVHAIDIHNPVRSSADDEIKNLPKLDDPITFRQFSGYLNADENHKKFLHYWFFEATEDPTNKPVMLWLGGEIGCSSLQGVFEGVGPFKLDEKATKVTLAEYSWNKLANVIFLESPTLVGYSYDFIGEQESDDNAARANYLALKSFFQKFPQYKSNKLYLSGDNYAGVFLPTLGALVDKDEELNFRGIAIGNGYLDRDTLRSSLVFFAYHHGFLGKSDWDEVSQSSCDGQVPTRATCNFKDDYSGVLDKLDRIFSQAMSPLNILETCTTPNDPPPYGNQKVGSSIKDPGPLCYDKGAINFYISSQEVRDALHIPDKLPGWSLCTRISYTIDYPLRKGGLAPQINHLIDSKRKLTLLIYNGDTDTVCNALGGEWFTDDLGLKMVGDDKLWHIGKEVGGFVKHYEGITFATVRGAGNTVPKFRPSEAFELIKAFLNSNTPNVYL